MSFIKKYSPVLVVIFISVCALYSLGFLDNYLIKDVSSKKYVFGDFSYTGQLKNGKFENTGLISLSNETKFWGQFKNGDLTGKFVYIDSDMLCFVGTFVDGTIVDGVFSNNIGRAIIKNDNNVNFESFKGWSYTGKINSTGQYGFGGFKYVDGSEYKGDFLHGLANNNGTYYTKDGEVIYSGNFRNGLFDLPKT